MTLQQQLNMWKDDINANLEIDEIVDELNDNIIDPNVGMTVKDPAIALIIEIESNRDAYISRQIANIEDAIAKGDN